MAALENLRPDILVLDVNLADRKDGWALAQWLGNAALYIGNDSGPSHLAAAAGAHVVAIFGPSDERVWAPAGARARPRPTSRGR